MPATHEPCSMCAGLGHVCPDADPTAIHEHVPPLPPCAVCGGRGLVAIGQPAPPEPEPDVEE